MDTSAVLKGLDELYANDKMQEAEGYMIKNTELALKEGDMGAVLTILNELIGYYRGMGDHDSSVAMADQAIKLARQFGLSGTVAYATTLLNSATALRASGKPEESIPLYEEAKEIYDGALDANDYRVAGLFNNWSGALEETGQYDEAMSLLQKAMQILETLPDHTKELATTYANMACVEFKFEDCEKATHHFETAMQLYESVGDDYHSALAKHRWKQTIGDDGQ